MALTAPHDDRAPAVLRALAEAGASFFPLAGALTRRYQTTHPARFAQDVERWQGDITATVNALVARLALLEAQHEPRLVLPDTAFDVALWFVADPERLGLRRGELEFDGGAVVPTASQASRIASGVVS